MNLMLKNSSGKLDGMFTHATISFVVVTVCIFISMFDHFSIGSLILHVNRPDSTLLLGYLGACHASYVLRRNNDKSETETIDGNENNDTSK